MFKKYKNDIILCFVILIVIIVTIVFFNIDNNKSKVLNAEVWLMGNKIDEIDLSNITKSETRTYRFDYYSENVEIKVELDNNMIRVISSDCPNKICVDTGWTSSPNKPIICMEYGFKILLKNNLNDYDIVVG